MKKLLIFLMIIMTLLTGCGRRTKTEMIPTKSEDDEIKKSESVDAVVIFEETLSDFADDAFLKNAHNAESLGGEERIQPLYKIESMTELEVFENMFGARYGVNLSSQLMHIRGKYQVIEEEFFEDNFILLVYSEGSSTCRYAVKEILTEKEKATVKLNCTKEKTTPHAEDVVARITTILVDRKLVGKYEEFDAVFA